MDVETALATNKVEDNSIIDGFKTVDKKVESYPELDWGPSVKHLQPPFREAIGRHADIGRGCETQSAEVLGCGQ